MSPIRNIRFSFACKEDINSMSTCNLRKYCKSFDRTIIDFRNKSEKELAKIKETNACVCGIFSESQVSKGYKNYRQVVTAAALTIGLTALTTKAYSQEENDPFKPPFSSKDTLTKSRAIVGMIIDDEYPEYPGGTLALSNFIKENIIYPSDSISGKVVVSFMVDTLGRTQNIKVKKSLSPLADAEVIRVVRLLVFKPALRDGKPVNSLLSLPFNFNLDKKENK